MWEFIAASDNSRNAFSFHVDANIVANSTGRCMLSLFLSLFTVWTCLQICINTMTNDLMMLQKIAQNKLFILDSKEVVNFVFDSFKIY